MGIEDLIDNIRALPPAKLAEVVDLVARLQARDEDQAADADLDAVAANPAAKARLNELIQVGLDQLARGEGLDAEAVFAELLGEA